MWGKIKKISHFFDDDIPYHSASLSFFTIFSLLPLVALLITIITKLPNFENYTGMILEYIMDFINPTHSQTLEKNLTAFLSNIDKLGAIGIFYLLFVFTMFFRDYEHIINRIHHTKKRSIYKVFILYFGFLFLVPIFFIAYSILSNFIEFSFSGQIFASIAAWGLFILLFQVSANTKISFKAALISSFITLFVLSITKTMFGYYVSVNTTYASIYGSFSIVLFFFLWIYVSWNIYLYGTKLCSVLNKGILIDKD